MKSPLIALLVFICSISFVRAAEKTSWQLMGGCRLLSGEYFDGDSFHVSWKQKNYVFRLYNVDAPETDAELEPRLREQAAYFGVTIPDVIRAGAHAKAAVAKLLGAPFTVATRWSPAPGAGRSQRYYAVVLIGKLRLDEELIKQGLARSTGLHAAYPDAAQGEAVMQHLRRLERQAAQQKQGIWALSRRTDTRETLRESLTRRLDKVISGAPDASLPQARRININTAPREDLLALPGVGPKTADVIIAHRPFKSLEDLDKVPGIGPKRMEQLRPVVSF